MPGSTTTQPSNACRPGFGFGHFDRCLCLPHHHSWRGDSSWRFCKPGHGDRHGGECPCGGPEHGPHDGGFGPQGFPGSPGHQASDAGYYGGSGEKLPEQGVPAAVPIMAVCGFVILLAGTVMRRIVLRVPA